MVQLETFIISINKRFVNLYMSNVTLPTITAQGSLKISDEK